MNDTKKRILTNLEHWERSANLASAFCYACRYARQHNLNGLADALLAYGVATGKDASEWFYDYYVADENAGAEQAKKVQSELKEVIPDALYMSNQATGFGNHGYTPEDIEPADKSDVLTAFGQAISFVKQTY